MSRRRSLIIVVAILVGSVAVAVVLIAQRPEPARQTVQSRVPFAATAPVVAGAGSIPVYGAGTVRSRAEVDITAEVAGKVVWVLPAFQSGGRVRPGQELFRIDDADYRSRVEQARASVAIQKVELLRVTEEAQIARSQYERFKAALARDSATLAEAELGLLRTSVHAPFAGVVLEESVDIGQFVAAGHSVGRLYAADTVEVVVPLSDADAALIPEVWELEAGNADRQVPARVVALYGDKRYTWDGYVDRADAALDERTRTIDVIVCVPNPFKAGSSMSSGADGPATARGGPPLLVGKFVEVEIDGLVPEKYFKVRRSALRPGNEVWAVRDDIVHIVPVQVLQRSDDEVFLTGALEGGQAVIVGGIQVAIEGMPVRTDAGDES